MVIKIYKIFKDNEEIERKELTKNNVFVRENEFYGLDINKTLDIQLNAITDVDLGKIINIESYLYRKKNCYNVVTNLYSSIILQIKE